LNNEHKKAIEMLYLRRERKWIHRLSC
jgi:hypothetical protein